MAKSCIYFPHTIHVFTHLKFPVVLSFETCEVTNVIVLQSKDKTKHFRKAEEGGVGGE